MKAILKFDLADLDDKLAHMRCVKSLDMLLVLFEEIGLLLEEHGINIDELVN